MAQFTANSDLQTKNLLYPLLICTFGNSHHGNICRLALWICGSVDLQICGSADLWICGSVDLQAVALSGQACRLYGSAQTSPTPNKTI